MTDFSLEDLVRKAKSSFHSWSLELAMGAIVTAQPWLGLPVINQITRIIVSRILTVLIDQGELGAFILNTKFLVSVQAQEYRYAVAKLIFLDKASDAEYEKAERNVNEAFNRLVRFKP
jgi:hypothetical protein